MTALSLHTPSAPPNLQRRLRVLHIIQNLNYGGMERLLADIVRGIDSSRFEPHVLALQYLGRFADGLDAATLHVAEPMFRASMLRPTALARRIASIAPSVVHTHSGVWYKATLAARMAGVPRLIHTEHGRGKPDRLRSRVIDAVAARRTDVVVAVSRRLGEELIRTRIAPAECVRVVQNGVDIAAYRPRPDNAMLRRQLDIPADVAVLGSIGRLEPIKGYEVMLVAFKHLLERFEGTSRPVLVIAGEGSERQRLERLLDEYGLRASVRLLGWRDDTHELHSIFSLFTMSSHSEGTSVSLLEAMSAGLCPVVTDVGGNGVVLGQRLFHRLVPPDTPQSLAQAWHSALQDDHQRREDGRIARERVAAEFSLRAMILAYERLYDGSYDHMGHDGTVERV